VKVVPITLKVNLLIIVSLTLGIGAVSAYLGLTLTRTIDEQTSTSLDQESEIVYEAIEQLMLPGEAPLVVNYFEAIGALDPRLQIYLYRRDGTPAFADNSTIDEVNARLDSGLFLRRTSDDPILPTPAMDRPDQFAVATTIPARTVMFEETAGDATTVRYLKPLLNLPNCTVCHGSDHTVRGVIDLRSDITGSVTAQRRAIISASGAFLFLVLAVGLVMSRFLNRSLIVPLQEIGATCAAVTTGDFEKRSGVTSNDELGVLSRTVNTMIEGLYERFVLSRFVSGSTLSALTGGTAGRTEELTFLFSDIRGFTSFTEGNDPALVVATLNAMLADQSEIIGRHGGDIDKYVGDEIVAVFSGADGVSNAAAAAIEIQHRITAESTERYRGLAVGIGINFGPVIVGEIGGADRADFTAIGDNVNVAARLCSGARSGESLVSDAVRAVLVAGRAEIAESAESVPYRIDGPYRMQVKGKREALRVYRLVPGADGADGAGGAAREIEST
jgi:adenylate cyclase